MQDNESAYHRCRFVKNVLWSWASVAVPILTALALAPYIILKLGPESYGLWSLAFSIVGYYNLLDLAFRSTVVKFTAQFASLGNPDKINELVNTMLACFSAGSALLVEVTAVLAKGADRIFKVPPALQGDFFWLILLLGLGMAVGVTLNVFTGCLEGLQRFDLASRVSMVTILVRSGGIAVLIAMGHGLAAMGAWAVFTQLLSFAFSFASFRRIFPYLRFSTSLVKLSMLKEAMGYGAHTLVAYLGGIVLDQSPSVLIGHYCRAAFVGYYTLPQRLLQYGVDMVGRAGMVVGARTAELASAGELQRVSGLAANVNRYCLTLFAPFSIVLLVHGPELMKAWLGPAFAIHSAPLLPIMLVGSTLATAAQFSSSTVLFGLGKHQNYARALLVEALAAVACMTVFLPRYGIVAAAVVTSSLMLLNRGLFTSWLVCKALGSSYRDYMGYIFTHPILTAVPFLLLALWLNHRYGPVEGWLSLLVSTAVIFIVFYGVAFFTCLHPEHRRAVRTWIKEQVNHFAATPS